MIPNDFLKDLLSRIDIAEVIGNYIKIRKVGANYNGLCPFHREKTPSFTVSPLKQFYHCFGCGAHGSVINFLMKYLGISFPEAVENLARDQGMKTSSSYQNRRAISPQLPAISSKENAVQQTQLIRVMQLVCIDYHQALINEPSAVSYLKDRGIDNTIILRFCLGYASKKWNNLISSSLKYDIRVLIDAGLVLNHKSGLNKRRYDRFRNRIMFPIRNVEGKVVAFGGRTLNNDKPRYLNSPETLLFKKGNELYGLFEAKTAIREKGFILIVEGYMDVVSLSQIGIPNVVATLGTACTRLQLQKIFQYSNHVIFSFDGDKAGRLASRRTLKMILAYIEDRREIKFLFLPSEHDPDSFVLKFGKEAFLEKIAHSTPLSDFLVKEIIGEKILNTFEEKEGALFRAKSLLCSIPSSTLRTHIIRSLSNALQLPFRKIVSLCEGEINTVDADIKGSLRKYSNKNRSVMGTEQRTLHNLLMFPKIAADLDADAIDTLSLCSEHYAIFIKIIEWARAMGINATFRHLVNDMHLKVYANTFINALDKILSCDENTRDLLLYDPEDNIQAKRHQELEEAAKAEVYAALARIRYKKCCERLAYLSSKGNSLNTEELKEFASLSKLAIRLKYAL